MTMVREFRDFLMRGNIVDLAVAVLIGAAFGLVIKSLAEDLITPIFAALGGAPDFSAIYFEINHSKFMIGKFINAIIAFIITAAIIFFFVIKPMNALMARLKKQEEAAPPPGPSNEEKLLAEIRDLLKQRADGLVTSGTPAESGAPGGNRA
jgi:large conductance mechanosensitive channel